VEILDSNGTVITTDCNCPSLSKVFHPQYADFSACSIPHSGCCLFLIFDCFHHACTLTLSFIGLLIWICTGAKLHARAPPPGVLDTRRFAGSPPEAMSSCLKYIEQRWGSIPLYLESIGFTTEWQLRLRCALLSPSPVNMSPSSRSTVSCLSPVGAAPSMMQQAFAS
jgi:hypothetical protein